MFFKTSLLIPVITIGHLGISAGEEFYFLVLCHKVSKWLVFISWQGLVTVHSIIYCYILFLLFIALERQCSYPSKMFLSTNYSITHLFDKMARMTQGLGFEPTEIILIFAEHASHPLSQET